MDVGRHHQVICITHLPQIAGLADTHFAVRKKVEGGRTQTSVAALSTEERVEEIARMIGGEKVSDRTRAAARDLMRRR
jgi:DNA repair protein RecN (Recombination protein N)